MRVHSVESMAALDGEGMRYELFLSGCPLRCVCCHNPDTWNSNIGTEISCEQLLKKILRYIPYFDGLGGVTFSGGEPLLQAEEIVKLGNMLSENNIGYALDTSCCVALNDNVKKAIDGADMVICDLKYPNSESMYQYTKGDFSLVIDFLEYLKSTNKRTWIRTVIIPNINDSEEWLKKYIEVLSPYKDIVEKYELLGFHTMGFFKYEQCNIENPLKDTQALDEDRLKELQLFIDKNFK